MKILKRIIDKLLPMETVYAHCDIPCGIYDPHNAQMAVHTVIKMVKLISEVKQVPPTDADTRNKMIRYVTVKEQHAEIAKHEIRILWGDYFKPEHVQKYPELHELVWKVMKLGSKAKQEVNLESAEELLETVNKIAEIFWKTKNIETVKRKSFYPTEREIVLPK
jgi:nickel superoxide dismutase